MKIIEVGLGDEVEWYGSSTAARSRRSRCAGAYGVNADAAITCALVQGVVDPQMCGIAGFGSLQIYIKG